MRPPGRRTATLNLIRRWWPAFAAAVCLALGVVVHGSDHGLGVDRWWYTEVITAVYQHPQEVRVLNAVAFFGRPWGTVSLATTSALILVFLCRSSPTRRIAVLGAVPLVALGVAAIIVQEVLKPLVGRHLDLAFAYPSGGIAGSSAVVVSLLSLACVARTEAERGVPWILGAMGWLALVALGAAVAALNLHYFTDVVGGWCLGAALGAVTARGGRRIAGSPSGSSTPGSSARASGSSRAT